MEQDNSQTNDGKSLEFWNQFLDILDKRAFCQSYLLMNPTYKGTLSKNAWITSRLLLIYYLFIIHEKKFVLKPTPKIGFLEFIIDSNSMSIEIDREKTEHILLKIRKFLQNPSPTIGKLASVVGSVLSIFPAILLGKLHSQALQKEKISLLKEKRGNYETKILSLNKHAIEDLKCG